MSREERCVKLSRLRTETLKLLHWSYLLFNWPFSQKKNFSDWRMSREEHCVKASFYIYKSNSLPDWRKSREEHCVKASFYIYTSNSLPDWRMSREEHCVKASRLRTETFRRLTLRSLPANGRQASGSLPRWRHLKNKTKISLISIEFNLSLSHIMWSRLMLLFGLYYQSEQFPIHLLYI